MIAENTAVRATFKNCALFTKCVAKIDQIAIYDAKDIDLIVPIYNLLENSSNYCDSTDSLWFYSKNEADNFNDNIADKDDFKSFKYKTKLKGTAPARN